MIKVDYNPDVLSCLANLSSDEVFTPPSLANKILDNLPSEIWCNPDVTFLEPCTKSGVFLREITKRLLVGLVAKFPDFNERLNHILTNQVFGLAITEITSLVSRRTLYCSKSAKGKYSIATNFDNSNGNILFNGSRHTWKNDTCFYCGASKNIYDRNKGLETHAYEFIHSHDYYSFKNMKFDVIVGNPPYQMSDGGGGRSATPIYHKFVETAKKMNPRYLTMIIPSRWFAGGKGLDSFRDNMLNDKRLKKLIDFPNSSEVFPGVDIAGGVCYFLWERNYKGNCLVTTFSNGAYHSQKRELNEFDVFVRDSKAISIIRKAMAYRKNYVSNFVSPRNPFSISSTYKPKTEGISCWFTQRQGRKYVDKNDIKDPSDILTKWKVLAAKAPIAGQTDFSKPIGFYNKNNTLIARPNEVCSESWLCLASFDSKDEAEFFLSYVFTKCFRFLLLQSVTSQNTSRQNFKFIPMLTNYVHQITDDWLYKEWNISDNEQQIISQKIKNIE